MKKLLVLAAAILVILAGCSKVEDNIPQNSNLKSLENPVPFAGHFEGYTDDTPTGDAECQLNPPPPGYPAWHSMLMSGEGTATHCGNSTLSSGLCVSTKYHITADSGLHFHGFNYNMEGSITAANGDIIYTYCASGRFTMVWEVDHWTNYAFYPSGLITGGTGRFEGATGNVAINVVQNNGTNPTMPIGDHVWSVIDFEGTIDY